MENFFTLSGLGSREDAALVCLTFLLAGIVKGVIGLGLPTVAIGLLGMVMTPMEAAALLIVPSLVTNVWQLAAGKNLALLLRRLWPMLAGICVGTWAGVYVLAMEPVRNATAWLGAALMVYAIAGLASFRPSVSPWAEPWLSAPAGAVTGIVTAATGVFVIPAVPYLQALNLQKDDLIQALGIAFTVSTLALAAGLALEGSFRTSVAEASLIAVVPALAGMFAGQLIRRRVRPAVFRACFLAGLLALGSYLLLTT
ncbi:MAG: hypothetical protein JWQ23_1204 [Herminiimonas sp.]|nr:hypothetical protein [Herminiimonas sp.]